MPDDISLPEWRDAGYPPTLQFSLPLADEELRSLSMRSPWISAVCRESSDQALRRWQERLLAGCPDESLGMSRHLARYVPVSCITFGEEVRLLIRLNADEERILDERVIGEPPSKVTLATALESYSLDSPLLLDFLWRYADLGEDVPPHGGYFCRVHESPRVLDDPWFRDNIRNFEDWNCALQLFQSRGGSSLYLRRSGSLGWLPEGELGIRDIAECFEDFVQRFTFVLCDWLSSPGTATSAPVFDPYVSWERYSCGNTKQQ